MNENNPLVELLVDVITFINTIAVPLVFALAFIFFLFGVFKYFFSTGADAGEKRLEGRKYIMWGIIALAVMFAIWGLVNILLRTFGLENSARPCLPTFSGPCNSGTPGSSTSRDPNGTVFGTNPTDLNGPGQPTGL